MSSATQQHDNAELYRTWEKLRGCRITCTDDLRQHFLDEVDDLHAVRIFFIHVLFKMRNDSGGSASVDSLLEDLSLVHAAVGRMIVRSFKGGVVESDITQSRATEKAIPHFITAVYFVPMLQSKDVSLPSFWFVSTVNMRTHKNPSAAAWYPLPEVIFREVVIEVSWQELPCEDKCLVHVRPWGMEFLSKATSQSSTVLRSGVSNGFRCKTEMHRLPYAISEGRLRRADQSRMAYVVVMQSCTLYYRERIDACLVIRIRISEQRSSSRLYSRTIMTLSIFSLTYM